MPDLYNYGQDRFARTNTYDAHCSQPTIQGKVLSIQYAINWYGAGAAHPNHHFKTYVFLLDPVIRWKDFRAFAFDEDGIRVLFPPYQVGPYAFGSHAATIPYGKVGSLLQEAYISALGIEHLVR